jgi:hypothetical protein
VAIDHDMLNEYARLTLRKRDLETEKRDINTRLAELEPKLLDQFEASETRSLSIAGLGTVHLRREGWARICKDGEKVTEAERQRALDALRRD